MPVGRRWGRVVLETLQLLLNMEPLALPGQMANGLSRGDQGTRWVLASWHTHCLSMPPVQTHLLTLSLSKRGPELLSQLFWMVTSSFWQRRKFRPGGPISGEIDLWLTIVFGSLLVVSLKWYLLLATFPVWLRVFSPKVLCCSSHYHHSYSPGVAGRTWHLESNRARFKFCLPPLWYFVMTQLLLASHTASRVLFCFLGLRHNMQHWILISG